MDAREGRLWVLNHEPYRPGKLSKLLLFLVKYVIIVENFWLGHSKEHPQQKFSCKYQV